MRCLDGWRGGYCFAYERVLVAGGIRGAVARVALACLIGDTYVMSCGDGFSFCPCCGSAFVWICFIMLGFGSGFVSRFMS